MRLMQAMQGQRGLANLIGKSTAFRQMESMIRRVAVFDATVLIEGETGTGKELAARAIHYQGARAGMPFVPINCGAIPDSLFENELFGHRRGAFTDARETQAGIIAQAHGGSLFLDEVDSLSAKAQVVLLRFLQDHEYRPLGSENAQSADVRIIAATNANLAVLAEQNLFRADLLFRLNVLSISMPPLRDRKGDVDLLAEHYLQLYCARYGLPVRPLKQETMEWMNAYGWPGNIRELENFIHRQLLMTEGPEISCDLPEGKKERRKRLDRRMPPAMDFTHAKAIVIEDFERRFLLQVLSQAGGNVTRAAHLAGKERRALGKLLKKYGIDPQSFAA